MKKLISGAIALIPFLFFSYFFSGDGESFRLSALKPIEAFQGIAFTLAFGFGVPIYLSYILSILILLGIPILIYQLILSLVNRLSKVKMSAFR